MKVRDVMTRQVVSVSSKASILEAGELMLQHNVSGIPVVDAEGSVVGIVTERDFLRAVAPNPNHLRPRWLELLTGKTRPGSSAICDRPVADVMTRNPITANENMPIEEVVQLLDTHHINRVPVVQGERLIGIVSRTDLAHALVRTIHATKREEALRSHMGELERQVWLHRTRC